MPDAFLFPPMTLWQAELTSPEQLDEIDRRSSVAEAVAIFKHSTRCSSSAVVLARLERSWSYSPEKIPFFFLDLVRYRAVSNAIASRYGIQHESPQLLIIRNGRCIYHADHGAISAADIELFTGITS